MAQGLKRRVLKVRGQAEALEPVDEVVGEQEEMKVGLVGEGVPGGNPPQGIVALELADDEFHSSAIVVEAPEVERLQREVRDEDLIVIFAELEQGQLGGRLVGLGPTDHDEAVGMGPAGGLVAELGHLEAPAGTDVPQVGELPFDREGDVKGTFLTN